MDLPLSIIIIIIIDHYRFAGSRFLIQRLYLLYCKTWMNRNFGTPGVLGKLAKSELNVGKTHIKSGLFFLIYTAYKDNSLITDSRTQLKFREPLMIAIFSKTNFNVPKYNNAQASQPFLSSYSGFQGIF